MGIKVCTAGDEYMFSRRQLPSKRSLVSTQLSLPSDDRPSAVL